MPNPKERIGTGARMLLVAVAEFKSSVSTSVLDALDGVLHCVENDRPLLYPVDTVESLRVGDVLRETLGVVIGVEAGGVYLQLIRCASNGRLTTDSMPNNAHDANLGNCQ